MRHSKELENSIVLAILDSDNLDAIPKDFSSIHFYDSRAKRYAEIIEQAKESKTPPEVYLFANADDSLKANYFDDNSIKSHSIAHVSAYGKIIEDFNVRTEIAKQEKRIKSLRDKTNEIPQELKYNSDFEDCIFTPEQLAEYSHERWKLMKPTKFRFKELNKRIFSFQTGEHCIIGGRSGTGKTAFGLQLLESLCVEENQKGIFISTEMSPEKLNQRMFDIKWYERNTGLIRTDADYENIKSMNGRDFWASKDNPETAKRSTFDNVTIVNLPSASISAIVSVVNHLQNKDSNYKNVCIDFVQNLKATDDHIQLTRVAYDLKALSLTNDCRVLTLSQTTRGDKTNGGGTDGTSEFNMNDLKGSGGLEESADLILGLWKNKEDPYKLHCKIAKDRMNGSDGIVGLTRFGVYFYG